jgi:hypothetical protein
LILIKPAAAAAWPAEPQSPGRVLPREGNALRRRKMGRGLLLWLIGIPLPIILIIWLLGGLS